ncbi:MAG: zinc ribbon domain-containing protein [Clostridia bacterium]|nr:zinc ribbon domain-containing protein [Clostridia bacterium]
MAFFEQIGKRLSETGHNVASKTKNLSDIAHLNNEISEQEKKISQLIFMLGQSYYERHKNDNFAEELDKIAKINDLYSKIHQNHERIKEINGFHKCVNCGTNIPKDAAFCNACGTKVEYPTMNKQGSSNTRICSVCHNAINKDNIFCNYCGTKIENS